jgi:acetoacetate decarboxylase
MDQAVYTIPAVAPAYGRPPYAYRGCPQLVVPFIAAPGTTRRLVPEPLVPNPDDLMFVMIGRMLSDEFGSNSEVFIAVPSRYGEMTGNFAVALYLDDDAAIASGREVWGWPKKAAEFRLDERDGVVTTVVTRGGADIVTARLHVEGPGDAASLGVEPTWFNLKLIPSVVQGAPPDVMQITSTRLANVRIDDVRVGAATVAFGNAAGDRLADLIRVERALPGAHFRFGCDLTLGDVVHDYLAAAQASVPAGRGVA